MATGIPNTEVLFPPVNAEGKVKLQRFLKTVSEFMDVEIEVAEVTIIRATPEEGRLDVLTVLNKIAANEKKKNQKEKSVRKGVPD